MLALFVGAPILVAAMVVLVRLTKPEGLTERARQHAEAVEGHDMDRSEGLPGPVAERLRDKRAWRRVGTAYVGEWAMVWKELLVGFTITGAIAALVPSLFFEALFPTAGSTWYLVPLQALLAPVLAVLTFIGSMGNGPLAAILAGHGVVFGAIMAFLYADFVVPPAIKINANYYGWRFAAYLAAVFSVAAIVAGIVVHGLFAVFGIVPSGGRDVAELATFAIDYTFWLNTLSIAVAAVLFHLARREDQQHGDRSEVRAGEGRHRAMDPDS